MTEGCEYVHTGDVATGWECPHPTDGGDRCPLHAADDVSRAELAQFIRTDAVKTASRTIEAIGTTAEEIPVEASAHPLDLRDSDTAVTGEANDSVPRIDLSGSTLTHVDLRQSTLAGDLLLTGADVGELRLDETRVEGRVDCTNAVVQRFVADGAKFSMACDLDSLAVIEEFRLNELSVDGILALTQATVECPLSLNKVDIAGNVAFVGTEFQGRIVAERSQFRDEFNATGIDAHEVTIFRRSEFHGVADFSESVFNGEVRFDMDTAFWSEVRFDKVNFARRARFSRAVFGGQAEFGGTTFGDVASFTGAEFEEIVSFGERSTFNEQVQFEGATFGESATFDTARMETVGLAGVTCRGTLSFKNAETGSISLDDAALEDLNCQDLACNGRLQVEDAHITGHVHLSFATVDGGAVFQDTVIDDGLEAVDTAFGDELDCREIDLTGTLVIEAPAVESTGSNGTYDSEALIGGCVGFRAADVETLVVSGVELSDTIFAGHLSVDSLTLRPANGSDVAVKLCGAEIRTGTIAHPAQGTVQYNLEEATLGDVSLAPNRTKVDPMEPFRLVRTEFDGFNFSAHRPLLAASNWEIHGSADGDELSATDREITYLAAKNGANQVSDRAAAGEFFKRELRSRRAGYRSDLSEDPLTDRLKTMFAWSANATLDLTAKYGEAPSRVFLSSIVTVGFFAAISFVLNPVALSVEGLVQRTLFSVQVFIAFVFGQPDVPSTYLVRWMVAIEGFLGAFFIGLFIFALTRSVSR